MRPATAMCSTQAAVCPPGTPFIIRNLRGRSASTRGPLPRGSTSLADPHRPTMSGETSTVAFGSLQAVTISKRGDTIPTRGPKMQLANRLAPATVHALATLQHPTIRRGPSWTPVNWFQAALMEPHRHRVGVRIPKDILALQANVMKTLSTSAAISTKQLRGLLQKALAFRSLVPHGDWTGTLCMFVQSKLDAAEISPPVAARYVGMLMAGLERLGHVMDRPTVDDFRRGLRAMKHDDPNQALPMDRASLSVLAHSEGDAKYIPVILMWRGLGRWDDFRGDTFPATGRNIALLRFEQERMARRGEHRRMRTRVVIDLNGVTKATKPPRPQPTYRCDHYVAYEFFGSRALAAHRYLSPLEGTDQPLIPWTTAQWLAKLKALPVPATVLAERGLKDGHWSLHSVKVGAAQAFRQLVEMQAGTAKAAELMHRALRHSNSATVPQALLQQTVCYHRHDPWFVATANGILQYTNQL